MLPTPPPWPGPGEHSFPTLLKSSRQKKRLSQLELSLAAGVSQRHLSFLESGRAKPSREMILRIGETLNLSLRERNEWLMAAGFAPLFRARHLDDPQMQQIMAALRWTLTNHEPFPAVAVDHAWNLRLANSSFEHLIAILNPEIWQCLGGGQRNLMRLFFHPRGVRPFVANWNAIAPLLWCRALREAASAAGQEVRGIIDELRPYHDHSLLDSAGDAALLPVLPLILEQNGLRISLFSVISTFGTAQDVTAEELRIETFFPADDSTRALFATAGGRQPDP